MEKTYTFMQETKGRLEDTEFTCPICMESKGNGGTILTCNECLKGVCAECTITLFIRNEGLMKCPHCRYTLGQTLPPWMVEDAAREMRLKIQERKKEYAEEG